MSFTRSVLNFDDRCTTATPSNHCQDMYGDLAPEQRLSVKPAQDSASTTTSTPSKPGRKKVFKTFLRKRDKKEV